MNINDGERLGLALLAASCGVGVAGLLLARHRLRSHSVAALVRVDAGRPYGMVVIIQEEGLGSSLEVTLELLEAWGTRSVPRGVCEQSVSIVIILVMT